MLPFRIEFKSGLPVYQQLVYAAKKAVISGQLRSGDRFPSVRVLSQETRINPNTAQKAVAKLIEEGLLEVQPGKGTFVADSIPASKSECAKLLNDEMEQLVVEAKRLGLNLKEVTNALKKHWKRLDG